MAEENQKLHLNAHDKQLCMLMETRCLARILERSAAELKCLIKIKREKDVKQIKKVATEWKTYQPIADTVCGRESTWPETRRRFGPFAELIK